MIRPTAAPLVLLALALPLAVRAAALPRKDADAVALAGGAVTPRIVRLADLPRAVPGETLPIRLRPEGVLEEAEAAVEAQKRNPPVITPDQLGAVTLDRNVGAAGPLSALAVSPGAGFEGITQNGFIPSEPTAAGGPLNVLSAGNVSVTVTNKDGSNRVEIDGATFFGIPASEGAISDAQCYYDALRGRFVIVAFTEGTSPTNFSNFYLAISQTNDARGLWYVYKFDMTKDGTTQTSNWSDYEGLGVSDDKLAMSAQQFRFNNNQYQYQKIRVIDRALAYAGGPVPYVDIVNFAPPPGGDVNDVFVTKPARNLTAGDATLHCFNVRISGGTNVTYREVTGPPTAPVISAGTRITVGTYSAPPDAPQLGSSKLVATNDCRPGDFVVRDGVLIVSWHTGATLGSSTVSAVRLFRLRVSDLAVLTDETFGAANTFYYYPAATVDSVGTIFLGFDRSSSTEYPSSYATGKRRGDAAIEPSVLLKAGVAATSQTRWGDYTGIDNDASLDGPGGSTAWYGGQWNKATNTFGTWITPLTFTYGQLAGSVLDDCDGSAGTSGDRAALAGVSVSLMQGATTVANATTDPSGAFAFGYLESGVYDLVVTPPAGGAAVDAVPGSGATSVTRVSASDLQVSLTNAQSGTGNQFLVTSAHPAPVATSIAPSTKNAGDPAFTLTVNGAGFVRCATVLYDGAPRPTTWVSGAQLTAALTAGDVSAGGPHLVTVSNPPPAGGASNPETLTVNANAYAVTVGVSGGGHVDRAPALALYPTGTPLTLTAVPDSGWAFTAWSGDTAATANPLALVVTRARTLTAAFADTAPPRVRVLTPLGTAVLFPGTTAHLSWSATDNAGVARVVLSLSRSGAGGPFDSLTTLAPDPGAYDWTVTGPATVDAVLRVLAVDAAGNAGAGLSDTAFVISGALAVDRLPVTELALTAVSPNPSRGTSRIEFAVPASARVRLSVFDVQGREVAVLADRVFESGRHEVTWEGGRIAAGLYFVRMSAPGRTFVRRVAVLP